MQVRRGQTKQTGFPQLASGEFGWSIDTQDLYIGNGAVSEGAPAVGNTRLLTEHDTNFFLLANGYTYGNGFVEYATTRSVQAKLDDRVSLNDFLPVTSTSSDFTAYLQNAINHAASNNKPLDLPGGTYTISGPIYIPPFTEIRGAGSKNTILHNVSTATATIFQTVDGFGNQFNPTVVNISSGGDITPQHVKISGMTLWSNLTTSSAIVSLDCLNDSIIENCVFIGDSQTITTSTQARGIELRGYTGGALTCDNVSIKDCMFQYLSRGIYSDYDIQNIKITNNKFNALNGGIVFASSLTSAIVGPTLVTITENNFQNINYHGIYVGGNGTSSPAQHTNIKSSNNTFVNVGGGYNNTQGELNQASPIINFSSFGNLSADDSFSRLDAINTDNISVYTLVKPVVYGPMVYNAPVSKVIKLTGVGLASVFIWPKSSYTLTNTTSPGQTITLKYTLNKPTGGIVRQGTIEVVANGASNTITDNFSYTGSGDGDCTFYLDASRSDVINVKVNNQGTAGVIVCSASVRQ